MPFDSTNFEMPAVETVERQHVRQLRDLLANLPPDDLYMRGYFKYKYVDHELCCTAACIAGWAAILKHGKKAVVNHDWDIAREAAHFLGLNYNQRSALFWPEEWRTRPFHPSEAVAVLDHYLATGEIDWSVAK